MKTQSNLRIENFRKRVRNMDSFGMPIALTYQGSSTFKTLTGGAMTILARLIVVGFLAYQTIDIA
jgi:hypothetical protein